MDGVVVVGASEGGVHALRRLIGGLTADFPAPILIVLHVGSGRSLLPSLLNDLGGMAAAHARPGDRLAAGKILVAPPDHHLQVTDGAVVLTKGPKENWARPAIDPLFRSAAEAFGPGAIGVLLTGQLNDGVAGLIEIKRRGGVVMVQDPADAEAPSMPLGALRHVAVDYCLPLARMPAQLLALAQDIAARAPPGGKEMADHADHGFASPTAQTCPECGGAMHEESLDGLTRYRCHIGHVMTAEVLAANQLEVLRDDIARVLRGLNERVGLCLELSEKHGARGRGAEVWRDAADETAGRIEAVRALDAADWLHPEAVAEAA